MTSDGGKTRNAEKVVALVHVTGKSTVTDAGLGAWLVTTTGVQDHPLLLPENASQAKGYCLKGFCLTHSLLEFKLDPLKGQLNRAAVVVISLVDINSTDFVVECVELLDKEIVAGAAKTMKKLMMLSSLVETDRPQSGKRVMVDFSTPPSSVKKCRTLTVQPSDASL